MQLMCLSSELKGKNYYENHKVNRFIVKYYFDEPKKLLIWLYIMNKHERISNIDEKACNFLLFLG